MGPRGPLGSVVGLDVNATGRMPRLARQRNSRVASPSIVRLALYVGRQVGAALALVAPALVALVALIQTMRLAPLVAGAAVEPAELASLAGCVAALLLPVALPAATVLALVAVLGRLETEGELSAMRAAGAGPARIAAGPLALAAAAAAAAGLAAVHLEPPAQGALRAGLARLMAEGAVRSLRPGVMAELAEGLTIRFLRQEGASLAGLFVEDRRDGRSAEIFASRGRLELGASPEALRLVAEEGAVFSRSSDGTLTRASFGRLETGLDLAGTRGGLEAVLPRRLAMTRAELARAARGGDLEGRLAAHLLHRRLALGPGALGLAVLAILVGLGAGGGRARPWALARAAGLVLAFHLVSRLGEAAASSGDLGPALGAWLPALAAWLFALGWVALRRARVLLWA